MKQPNIPIEWSEAIEISKQAEQKKVNQQSKFNENLCEAKEEVMEFINSGDPFSYTDIENIMHGYGLEMDYIEEFLI